MESGSQPAPGGGELFASRALTAGASVFFGLAAAWELLGPLLAGHYATSAGVGISAENMLRWHVAGPVLNYTAVHPGAEVYYSHHPWGIFWTELPLVALLGHHDFVCRLPPVLLSIATPPLLYLTGRALWRPAAGAAAAVSFTVLPITLSFAQFNALEVPVIAWGLLATWGFVRHSQTGDRRHRILSTLGAMAAMNSDWPGFLLVGGLLGFGLAIAPLRRPGGFEPLAGLSYWIQWRWWLVAALLTAGFYLLLFRGLGTLPNLLESYTARSRGHDRALASVLEHRRYWIELCFTPIAIALGKLGLAVVVGRVALLRREREAVPLVWLGLAAVQYFFFWQGAEVHVFWPHYFAAYFALAMGAMVATLTPALERAVGGMPSGAPAKSWAVVLALAVLPQIAILRDGLPALAYARGTGGRFNEKGLLIDSDGSKTAFLQFIEPRLSPKAVVDMHEGMKLTWSQMWALRGREIWPARPPPVGASTDGHDIYLLDTRFASDEAQAALARQFHVVAVGPFWMIRTSEGAAPLDAYSILETEPSAWEWYLVSGTEPHREVVADPYLTWELRLHFDQPAPPPLEPPRTFEQQRIAHNLAVVAGDEGSAANLEQQLLAQLTPNPVRLADGLELLGTRFVSGAGSTLTLLLKSTGRLAERDGQVRVRSEVLRPARLSTTMADPAAREVGLPLSPAPRRFRAGFLYEDEVPIRKRPGTESFRVLFAPPSRSPRSEPLDRSTSWEVLRLE